MPTYTYKCEFCENEFERVLKVDQRKDPESKPCPHCNKYGDVKQIITAGARLAYPTPKPPEDWKSFTNKLKKNNPGSDFTTWGVVLFSSFLATSLLGFPSPF
jgi:putative FmdB family regulatory protein